jgi:hypothetical protein
VNLTSVEFVEDRHHHKSVEYDCKVLRGIGIQLLTAAGWDVQYYVALNKNITA